MASHIESAHDLLDLDIQTLRQFVQLFPDEGLSKVLTGYLSSGISKYPLAVDGEETDTPDLSEGGVALFQDVPLSQDDCLLMMTVSTPKWFFNYVRVCWACNCLLMLA
jgi:superkiller protein 3